MSDIDDHALEQIKRALKEEPPHVVQRILRDLLPDMLAALQREREERNWMPSVIHTPLIQATPCVAVEVVALAMTTKGETCVFLTRRPQSDPYFAGKLHAPGSLPRMLPKHTAQDGTVLFASETEEAVMQRLARVEFRTRVCDHGRAMVEPVQTPRNAGFAFIHLVTLPNLPVIPVDLNENRGWFVLNASAFEQMTHDHANIVIPIAAHIWRSRHERFPIYHP